MLKITCKILKKYLGFKVRAGNSLTESLPAPAKVQRHEQVLFVGHSEKRNCHCQKTAQLKLQQPRGAKQEEEGSREAIAVLHLTGG